MPPWLKVTLLLIAVPVALFCLDRLMLRMERRGWIYWRKRPPGSASPGRAVLNEFQQLVEPEIRHVQEHERQQRAMIDDESDDDR